MIFFYFSITYIFIFYPQYFANIYKSLKMPMRILQREVAHPSRTHLIDRSCRPAGESGEADHIQLPYYNEAASCK